MELLDRGPEPHLRSVGRHRARGRRRGSGAEEGKRRQVLADLEAWTEAAHFADLYGGDVLAAYEARR